MEKVSKLNPEASGAISYARSGMRRLAAIAFGVTVASFGVACVYLLVHPFNRLSTGDAVFDVVVAVVAIAYAWLGRLIVVRAANRIGLILLAIAVAGSFVDLADIVLKTSVPPWPGWLGWVGLATVASLLLAVSAFTILPLVFPSGAPPTSRWRWVLSAWGAGVACAAVGSLLGTLDVNADGLQNPLQPAAAPGLIHAVGSVGGWTLFVVVCAGIASLVVRTRRGDAVLKAQVRWLTSVVVLAIAFFLLSGLGQALAGSSSLLVGNIGWLGFMLCLVLGVPIAIAIAVLKYRLFEIDVVIRKAVVVGLLALFITVAYAAIVALVSRAFRGSQAGSFLAAATLAVVFAPARDQARRIADRLVYGKRATPYEVLAEFSEQVGSAYASDDVLARMARLLQEGTGASGARVLLRVGTELREEAAVGDRGDETIVPVVHQAAELGALAVSMPAADPMNPAKLQLVEHLASQAGLVLRNVKLIEELKASRQRLVAAQDEERRKIERNIHDGAQQQLVALAVQLKLAEKMVGRDSDKERELLATLALRTNEALEDLRNLARGIYPPLLRDKGLPAALEAQARRAIVSTTVATDGIGRFSPAIESAVYFSCLEALQNVAKYANATNALIILSTGDGTLQFTVSDDGAGFDTNGTTFGTGLQGMADRLAAIGGEFTVVSAAGAGTTISGSVPA